MEELREFKKRIKKVDEPRNHRAKNSYGIRDAFLYLQSHKWFNIGRALREPVFQKIIREVNNQLAFEVMKGHAVTFPESMGNLEIRKCERYVDIDGGKIKTNYMIDWDKTLQLWCEDEQARKNRTIVRDTSSRERYTILYNRRNATYNNKWYFQFRANRAMRRVLSWNIKMGQVDAYNMYGNAIC